MSTKQIDKDAFAYLWNAGETLDTLASRFGVSRATVMRFAVRHGLPFRGQPNVCGGRGDPTPEEILSRSAEVRSQWTDDEYERRSAEKKVAWEAPVFIDRSA